MSSPEIDHLIRLLSRLPGLGPRSAVRVALYLLARRDSVMQPLARALGEGAAAIRECSRCGNLDSSDPCGLCRDSTRDTALICVVENVADLWAMERGGQYRGLYHVLGGVLSALDGVGPEDLRIASLVERATDDATREVILALPATVDGQTTAHYLCQRLDEAAGQELAVTRLAHGVPVGGALDYLDDGTIAAALKARRPA